MTLRVLYLYSYCGRNFLFNKFVTCFSYCCARNNRLYCEDFGDRQNLYEILGISRTSNTNEIKSAYYKLSFIYHPDKNIGNEEAARRFQEIRRAYEILGNTKLKQRYDQNLTPRPIGDSNIYTDNKKAKVEWSDDDYTSFYRKQKEVRYQKPMQFAKVEKDYGSYFKPNLNVKRSHQQQQSDSEEVTKKLDTGFAALVFVCGIWFIIMIISLITEEKKSPPE